MAEHTILTGFKKPWRNDPVFKEVMALANRSADKKNWEHAIPAPLQNGVKPIKDKGEK